MSVGIPLFTLVREDDLEVTADDGHLDYVAGAGPMAHHDEIKLWNDSQEPAATPTGQALTDLDYQKRLAAGGRYRVPRILEHSVTLHIDWIGNDIHAKLKKWMQERARIFFTPGWGRHTEIAYRPMASSDTLTDLTGRHQITSQDNNSLLHWDEAIGLNLMRGPWNTRQIVATPAGAGQVFQDTLQNRWIPSYPESAIEGYGAGKAGWVKDGADAADITFALITNGFGHTDCPHSLRVTTSDIVSTGRGVIAQGLWNSADPEYQGYTFTGSGTASVRVWLRGRFPSSASVYIGFFQLGGNSDVINLAGLDLKDWTPFDLTVYSADWSTGLPLVDINISAGSYGDRADFEIGPMEAYQIASAQISPKQPWVDHSAGAVLPHHVYSSATFRSPPAGTAICSFWWPADYDDFSRDDIAIYHRLLGTNSWDIFLSNYLTGDPLGRFRFSAASSHLNGTISPLLGQVNVLAAVWGTKTKRVYFNGTKVAERTTEDDQDSAIGGVAETHYFGDRVGGDNHMAPLLFLSGRIDREMMSDAEVAHVSRALRDPIAIATVAAARGRIYEIAKIPETPRLVAGGTHWLGELRLRQVDYDPDRADYVTEEIS